MLVTDIFLPVLIVKLYICVVLSFLHGLHGFERFGNFMCPIGLDTYKLCMQIEQYIFIKYQVGFGIISNKFEIKQ